MAAVVPAQAVQGRPPHQARVAAAALSRRPPLPAGDHRPGAGDRAGKQLFKQLRVPASLQHLPLGALLVGIFQGLGKAGPPPQVGQLPKEVGMAGAGAAGPQAVQGKGRIEADPAVVVENKCLIN